MGALGGSRWITHRDACVWVKERRSRRGNRVVFRGVGIKGIRDIRNVFGMMDPRASLYCRRRLFLEQTCRAVIFNLIIYQRFAME